VPKPVPKPELKPVPKPEPKPEVKPVPKPEPKPEVKPAPKPEPKPEVKPTPKPESKPEVKPTAKPDVSPPKVVVPNGKGDSAAPPAVQVVRAEVLRAEVVRPGNGSGTSGDGSAGSAQGRFGGGASGNRAGLGGSGNGTASGRAAGGPSASEMGRYNQMIHERFYGVWEQPISVVRSNQNFVAILKIRIRKDGSIIGSEIVTPSGNPAMDESVQRAAEKVQRIEALPTGMIADPYEVRIAFKLDQG